MSVGKFPRRTNQEVRARMDGSRTLSLLGPPARAETAVGAARTAAKPEAVTPAVVVPNRPSISVAERVAAPALLALFTVGLGYTVIQG